MPQLSGAASGHVVVHAKPPSSAAHRSASAPQMFPHEPQLPTIDGSTHPASAHSISLPGQPASASSPPSDASSEASIIVVPVSNAPSFVLTWLASCGRLPPSQSSLHCPVE